MYLEQTQEKSVCVCTHATQFEFDKVRTICRNIFLACGESLKFEKIATNHIDTDFNYAIMVEKTDGRKISKKLLENIIISVNSVIFTLKSF